MAKRNPGVKKELREAKQAELDYQSALQRQRMNKERLRKAENHLKFRNGGMIERVGLHELPEALLLGALLFLARLLKRPEVVAEALKMGEKAMAEQAAKKKQGGKRRQVFIAFDEAPPQELLAALKALELRFNRRNKEWRGPANVTLLKRAVLGSGWDKHVLRSGYVP